MLANTATTNTEPATHGADNSPRNTLTTAFAASDSSSIPQDGLLVGSGAATLLPEENQTEILSTEKALDNADQAINSMQPALGMANTTANTTTVSDAIDSVISVYKTWEKAVATMKDVMVVVDTIAEVILNPSTYD